MNNIFIYAFKLFIKYFLKILLLFLITEKIIINYKTFLIYLILSFLISMMENSQTSTELQNQIMSNSSLIKLENISYEESQKNLNNQKTVNPSKQKINLLYQTLFELYSQKQFKKVYKTMKLKSDRVGKFFLMEWKLLHLRMEALQQILDNKLSLYYNLNKISHFSDYMQDVNNDINNWIILIEELIIKQDKVYTESFIEFVISFILKKCLIIAKRYIHTGYIKDAIIALSLGLRIINESIKFISSPDTYYLAGEIFLYLSSFMITEKNYKTAMNLIGLAVKFNYKSLEIKLSKNINNYQLIFDINKYQNEIKILYKLIFNLAIAFYQLAICQENLNNSYNAYYSIKTSNFFLNFCNIKNIDLFKDLIEKIETRLLMRNRIIIFFEKYIKKEELEDKIIKSNSPLKRLISHEEKRQKKFNKLKIYLEKLKLIDVDEDEPDLFNRVGEKKIKPFALRLTKQLQLLNYMMNDDFKDIVFNMKKIEINKPNKETIYKIQKRIINLKNKQHFNLENNLQKKLKLKRKTEGIKSDNNNTNSGKKEKDESNEKIYKNKHRNFNKSNVLKSTTVLSNSTTIPKKNSRIRSAFHRVDPKNLIKENSKIYYNTNKALSAKDSSSYFSMYSTPSRYLSLCENNNNFSNKLKRSNIFLKKSVFHKSNSINIKLSFKPDNKNNKSTNKKNMFKYSKSKIATPKYNCNKYYLTKGFRNKYNFLEKQFDKEIEFHKNLLKTKYSQEELKRPEPPDLREIKENSQKVFYSTFINELMNVKEKQIIFDKREMKRISKPKVTKRFLTPEPELKKLNLSENGFLSNEEIYEINDNYINKMTNKIYEISKHQKFVNRLKKY